MQTVVVDCIVALPPLAEAIEHRYALLVEERRREMQKYLTVGTGRLSDFGMKYNIRKIFLRLVVKGMGKDSILSNRSNYSSIAQYMYIFLYIC